MSVSEVFEAESNFISVYELVDLVVENDPEATYQSAAHALLILLNKKDCPQWHKKYYLFGMESSSKDEAGEEGIVLLMDVQREGEEPLNRWNENDDIGFKATEIIPYLESKGLKISDEVISTPKNTGASHAASASEESPDARARRRLARLRELGGNFVKRGDGWETTGKYGSLAQLEREEKAAGRRGCDRSDIRKDLMRAVKTE